MSGARLVVIVLALVICAAALVILHERPPVFTGAWRFSGTDPQGHAAAPLCRVEIDQHGDRADLRARALDGSWTCTGRGEIQERTLRFQWAGEAKGWHGTATLTLEGETLRGSYLREGERSEAMGCVGERE